MIIVTGATKGLGAAICARLQSQDKKVFGLARSVSRLSFDGMDCDVSSYENVKAVAEKLKVVPSEEVRMVPASPITTKVLFA